ncbi:MAG: FMNH2-dependent alkanesulfonate monooxygenase [Capsulimonadales bacterium]|nr:FMNH2-dependent alkanesulfonate monooxygenase [Capsulimonadales bacterium]
MNGLDVFWYLPTQGDERYLGTSHGLRKPTPAYLQQITQAVDSLGYGGMLLGTGTKLDPLIVATSLIHVTKRLKFLVAARPSIMTPALWARMAASFDQLSQGRILLNIVTGGSTEQLESDGIFADHEERYEITDEFLHIWRSLMLGETVNFEGKHLRIKNGQQQLQPIQKPYPPLYFGGSSPAALDVAARHIDVYLSWGEPPAMVREKIEEVRRRAATHGRTLRFGIRLHIIARETDAEAWAVAEKLIQHVSDESIQRTLKSYERSESEGQKRMASLHNGRRDSLEIYPNLWAGVGLARGGAGTALVGSGQSIARLMGEYQELGIDTFVLSGYPSLEEAYHCAEYVFPHLKQPVPATSPFNSGTEGPQMARWRTAHDVSESAVQSPLTKVAARNEPALSGRN